jgi:site-specific DNA recombinase
MIMKNAAIYARVSSEQQREAQTIKSQTAAIKEFSQREGYLVPEEWIFEDEGYSGSTLIRPGLERVRDLAAEGQIEALLVYSPDRLSRKYAYQVVLLEEFGRCGVEVVFVNSPSVHTPEEQLLVQFQGMIAEYERAQITERSRRGKRHRARSGLINVLSGAPYGYRYVKKTDSAAAYFEVIESEAEVVRMVYNLYTTTMMSIGAITRALNDRAIPTRKGISQWERSTVWALLRNPSYLGKACFGKTRRTIRRRVTRLLRLRGGYTPRNSCSIETPRSEWVALPVPALITEAEYELAQERLNDNKKFSLRHTKEPTLLQGLLVCKKCGYAFYRTSTRTSRKKIFYYRCLGSDHWRYPAGSKCDSKPIRQDLLDDLVWKKVMVLLEDPTLVENEIHRRLESIKNSSGVQQKRTVLEKETVRVQHALQRLLDAYQESLLTIDELRQRTNDLRKREKSLIAQLHSMEMAEAQEQMYFGIMHSLKNFLSRLDTNSNNLTVVQKQQVVRSLVKEVQIDGERIHIIHSIPIANKEVKKTVATPSYELCLGSKHSSLRRSHFAFPSPGHPPMLRYRSL